MAETPKVVVQRIPPGDWDWIPPEAKSLDEAFRMGARPPQKMTRAELEALFPKK